MPTNTFLGRSITVNDEGFLTVPTQWDEELAVELARLAGIENLTDEHWAVIRFAHDDYLKQGAMPTLRRLSKEGGFEVKRLFELFPGKPAKKIAYIAGGTKPVACV
ncbi:MAG: TusE/DsrC/DsvC family sulfur relay protein [Actinomycetaceae bacterium]|nr:TusE/DsrC/DsvC family sulfur relay protein [Arcanobacterium sp.]MDD7505517.1 TusE/DsrC/DsvC family sulfur relay protein [Actinomycetaceae bacterium]MDY6143498.1 TusE/DsrC/DsvC family sulfur relay protein [Arcanobacterium sp.]